MKIGVIADCFKAPDLFGALHQAKALQLQGVQIYATTGFFSPSSLTSDDKAKVKEALREAGLEVSALCGDMGGYGFQIAKDNPERIGKTKRIIDLAAEFHTAVVTTHIGVIPADKKDPRYAVMLSALRECGVYAQAHGVTLAIETGPEKARTLLAFLQDTYGGLGLVHGVLQKSFRVRVFLFLLIDGADKDHEVRGLSAAGEDALDDDVTPKIDPIAFA